MHNRYTLIQHKVSCHRNFYVKHSRLENRSLPFQTSLSVECFTNECTSKSLNTAISKDDCMGFSCRCQRTKMNTVYREVRTILQQLNFFQCRIMFVKHVYLVYPFSCVITVLFQNMPTLKVKVQHNIFTYFIMFAFALGLLQSAVISLYTVYLTWSALLYNPGQSLFLPFYLPLDHTYLVYKML